MARISVSDLKLAQSCGADILLGKSFAFIGAAAFATPELSWVARLFGRDRKLRPQIVSLLAPERVALPGVSLAPTPAPSLRLCSVTTDKTVYAEQREDVVVLVLDLLSPLAEKQLCVLHDGQPFSQVPVQLDANGAGLVRLRELPVGAFSVELDGASAACSFSVASYRLSALVATLVERRVVRGVLSARLLLRAYGRPVDGEALVWLSEPSAAVRVMVCDGLCELRLPIDSGAALQIQVSLAKDPSRTASVPLPGSRLEDREPTCFSSLGAEIRGALLPADEAHEVRGIYLDAGAEGPAPLALERVDAREAKLRAKVALASLQLVVVDPAMPRRRQDAVDVATAHHPALSDAAYRATEQLFETGSYALARAKLIEARAAQPSPHPNYAYLLACCCARSGAREEAVAWLRAAIEDGLQDASLLATDDDLATLRSMASFQALCDGGLVEHRFEDVRAGQVISLPVPGPLAFVAAGAFVGNVPWEGWAALLAPDAPAPDISLIGNAVPGESLSLSIDAGEPASLYVVVQDARMRAGDTPSAALARQMKQCVERAGARLGQGRPAQSLASLLASEVQQPAAGLSTELAQASVMRMQTRVHLAAEHVPHARSMAAESADGASAMAPAPAQAALSQPDGHSMETSEEASPALPVIDHEPRGVLHASLIDAPDGCAKITVQLGHLEADYVIEVLALRGRDWGRAQRHVRAEKTPAIVLELPAFMHERDAATGRVRARTSSPQMRVKVLRDGHEVALWLDGSRLAPGAIIERRDVDLTFAAAQGQWTAAVEDVVDGAADWAARSIEAPGVIRQRTRSLCLLSAGEKLCRGDDPGLLSLRVLPGLQKPFALLVEATANYEHACSEQTAAKLVAGCAMWLFAPNDAPRRQRAEAIIEAGIRRVRTMFMPGRGFAMYPGENASPDGVWGHQTAYHLLSLESLRGSASMSVRLRDCIDEGLSMAREALTASGISWPVAACRTARDAYLVMLFSKDELLRREAISVALTERTFASSVTQRAEDAYAAAVLLLAGEPALRREALRRAGRVTEQFGEHGRLYSTVDSAAAIALMGTLLERGIASGDARVLLDGVAMRADEAHEVLAGAACIEVSEGVVAVEASRMFEQDWSSWEGGVPLHVSLECDGRAVRCVSAGDDVQLRVAILDGYVPGDLLWICLPEGLSRLEGGAQIKRFSVDFSGERELLLPLVVTGQALGVSSRQNVQHLAVSLRNMFDEHRAGSPGLIAISLGART